MNILNLLAQNLGNGSRTRHPDDAVPYPTGFRGKLTHDTSLCTACGTCVYTCSPSAITIYNNDAGVSHWNYTEDRCTFCGYCVQHCPTHALDFDREAPRPIMERAQHYIFHEIVMPPCRICGKPAQTIPEMTLKRLYGTPLPEEIIESQGLCEHCRQELVSKRFLKAVVGKGVNHNE